MAANGAVQARSTGSVRDLAAQSGRFVAIGTAGTIGYLALYVVAATAMQAVAANVIAWFISTIATNEAHRRVTFRVHDRKPADGVVSMVTSMVGLGVSTVCIQLVAESDTVVHLLMVVLGTATGGILRFVLLRYWFGIRTTVHIPAPDVPENPAAALA